MPSSVSTVCSFVNDAASKIRLAVLYPASKVRLAVLYPASTGRLAVLYPASTGRNMAEVLRVIDSLQTSDNKGVTTPINWQVDDEVIVSPSVSTEDAKKKLGKVRQFRLLSALCEGPVTGRS